MAQQIKQGNIFGRVGSGVGRGLSETLPQEMNRGRLAEGLKRFENDSPNLDPLQRLIRVGSIPGALEHPEFIRSVTKLANQRQMGNTYSNLAGGGYPNFSGQSDGGIPRQEPELGMIPQEQRNGITPGSVPQQKVKRTQPEGRITSENNRPSIVNLNPARSEAVPRGPFTPQEKGQWFNYFKSKGANDEQADQLTREEQDRQMGRADIEAKKTELQELNKAKADALLNKKFARLLGLPEPKAVTKEGEKETEVAGLSNILPGDIHNLLKGDIDRRILAGETPEQASDKLAKKAMQLHEAENSLKKNASKGILEASGTRILDNLLSARSTFGKFGIPGKKLLKNRLTSLYGFSDQKASEIAFERSEPIQKRISSFKPVRAPSGYGASEKSTQAAKEANYVIDNLGRQDSLLAIIESYRERDPDFDSHTFLKTISEMPNIEDDLKGFQRKELIEGDRGLIPTWADFKYFPVFGRSRASD